MLGVLYNVRAAWIVAGALAFAGTACSANPPPPPAVIIVVPPPVVAAPAASAEPAPSVRCLPHMAFVAGGTLGSGDKAARVADYCMDVTETTAGAYALCAQAGACSEADLRCAESWTYGREDMLDHPINCVSWQDADRYCQFAGKRLPTFEEWEWAAQGRDEKRRFSWGDAEPGAARMCWSRGIARLTTCAVGGFPESRTPQGIDDLFGNVWEWLAPAERNGSPNVARGGSWQNDSLDMLEGENAGAFIPSFVRNEVVGFRCVYDGEKPRPPAKTKAAEPPPSP